MSRSGHRYSSSPFPLLRLKEDSLPKIQVDNFRCGLKKCGRRFQAWTILRVEISLALTRMNEIRCPICGSKKVLAGEGRRLSEDRSDRAEYFRDVRAPNIEERKRWWIDNGEKGLSSQSLFNILSGKHDKNPDYPRDASDFRRCVLLLDLIPEWRERLEDCAVSAPGLWPALIRNWDALENALMNECPDLDFQNHKPSSFSSLLGTLLNSSK